MSAIRVFQDLPHERESRYPVTLLWIHELLLPTLADPRVPRQLCLSLARTAAKIDPFFNNRLSGYIDESLFGRSGLPVDSATRLLGILIETAEPTGLGPLLRRILLHLRIEHLDAERKLT